MFLGFLLVLVLVPTCIIWQVVKRLKSNGKKALAFNIAAISGIFFLFWIALETIIYFNVNASQVDNPWFVWAGNHTKAIHPNLPYLRKANVNWTGRSDGDLAVLNYDRDPYGQEVTYITDNDGFHNEEQIAQADIAIIGDSYSEAGNIPYEHSFARQLESLSGKKVKNFGVVGFTTPHESIVLSEYAFKANPKK